MPKSDYYATKKYKNAYVTVATKVTPRQAAELDWLAHDNGMSRYELTRRVLIDALALTEGSIQGSDQGSIQGKDQGSIQGKDQGSIQGSIQGKDQGSDQGSDQESIQGSDQGSDQDSDQGNIQGSVQD